MTVEIGIIISLCAVFLYLLWDIRFAVVAIEVLYETLEQGAGTSEDILEGIWQRTRKSYGRRGARVIEKLAKKGHLEVCRLTEEGEKGYHRTKWGREVYRIAKGGEEVYRLTEKGEEGAKRFRDAREALARIRRGN